MQTKRMRIVIEVETKDTNRDLFNEKVLQFASLWKDDRMVLVTTEEVDAETPKWHGLADPRPELERLRREDTARAIRESGLDWNPKKED